MAEQVNRKAIRDKLAAILKAKVDGLGSPERVFSNRVKPFWEEELPALNVYTRNEAAEIFNQAPREYQRTLNLYVDVVVKADSAADDSLDEITRKVEKAIFVNETLDQLVADTVLSDTEMELSDDGKTLFAVARMTWVVTYYTLAPGDEALDALTPFETAHVEMKPAGSTVTTPPITDDVMLEQPEVEEDDDEEVEEEVEEEDEEEDAP